MLRHLALGAVCFAALISHKAEAQNAGFGALPCWWYESYPTSYAPKPRSQYYLCNPPAYRVACYDANWQLKQGAFCAKPGKWLYIGRPRRR